jgi:hypothetical protein
VQFMARDAALLDETHRVWIGVVATATRDSSSPAPGGRRTLPLRFSSWLSQLRHYGLPRIWIGHNLSLILVPRSDAGNYRMLGSAELDRGSCQHDRLVRVTETTAHQIFEYKSSSYYLSGVPRPVVWVRSTLVEVALASVRSGRRQPKFFSARYHGLAARRGGKRAAIAVAHSVLLAIYRMLTDRTHFEDLGPTYLDTTRRQAIALRTVKRLEELGFTVTIEEPAA